MLKSCILYVRIRHSQTFLNHIMKALKGILPLMIHSCSHNPKTPQIPSFFYEKWLLFGDFRVPKSCFSCRHEKHDLLTSVSSYHYLIFMTSLKVGKICFEFRMYSRFLTNKFVKSISNTSNIHTGKNYFQEVSWDKFHENEICNF